MAEASRSIACDERPKGYSDPYRDGAVGAMRLRPQPLMNASQREKFCYNHYIRF